MGLTSERTEESEDRSRDTREGAEQKRVRQDQRLEEKGITAGFPLDTMKKAA